MDVVTRFAPSPTGDLHLGHAFAAHVAYALAECKQGRFLVRIEDIDATRCREEFVARILDDLRWLGLHWAEPVVRQSARMPLYARALDVLRRDGLIYPCFCTRRQIREEIAAAGAAPQGAVDDTMLYPGTCRHLSQDARAEKLAAGGSFAWRLDAAAALRRTGPLSWEDAGRGQQVVAPEHLGDVVLARKEIATSYHLAVVVDDAAQGVTDVSRGDDLFAATAIHRLLYALLNLPVPVWHHHPLCRDASGRRFAKRDRDVTLRALRAAGHTPADVLAMAAAAAGVVAR